jgi:peptidoglycan/LPS O-acetylase OafA/YrhL
MALESARSLRLDGLRGVAILLVIYSHGGLRFPTDGPFGALYLASVKMGWSGVDLFFVLSGFLITGILVRTRDAPRFFHTFYARRTLRIFPVYYAWLAFILLAAPAMHAFARFDFSGGVDFSALWYWTYTSNVGFVFAGGFPHTLLALTWSLAIEEQFYLLWPLAVKRLGESGLWRACIACIVLAPLLRGAWLWLGGIPLGAFVLTPCRMDCLAVGAAIAIMAQKPAGIARLQAWAPRVLAATGVLVVALVAWRSIGTGAADPLDSLVFDPYMQGVGYSLLAFFFGSVVVLAAFPRGRGTGWLELGILRTFGKYSYAIYLTHTFVGGLVILFVFSPIDHPGWIGALASYAVGLAAMLGVGMASWWVIEVHFQRLKRRFAYPDRAALPE